jgi:shikimate dehydrogenase
MDRYAVIGNPIAHSKSPQIHAEFARQSGQSMQYEAVLGPEHGFADTVRAFAASGGRGMNVTVPFKLEAYDLCDHLSERAQAAGAVNTLSFLADGIHGDNTDGVGLIRDLEHNHACPLAGTRVLLLGAGGAARGVLLPLIAAGPAKVTVANRSPARALELAERFRPLCQHTELAGCGFDTLPAQGFDVIINATSASLSSEVPPIPVAAYDGCSLAYDMMYGPQPTAFMQAARAAGARRVADGLGMLVEQAAESFHIWRGLRPDTPPVLALLRARLAGAGA